MFIWEFYFGIFIWEFYFWDFLGFLGFFGRVLFEGGLDWSCDFSLRGKFWFLLSIQILN
jgi:hypothetical protein